MSLITVAYKQRDQ